MTPKQKAVIERARNTTTKVVIHDWHQRREGRVYRETAGINTLKKRNVLQLELERLVTTWNRDERKWR